MRFLLVPFALAAACAQDGATRADWPHYGGTQLSWSYSARSPPIHNFADVRKPGA
jgi:hypothetical protein